MQIVKALTPIVLLAVFSSAAFAENASSKGTATVQFEGAVTPVTKQQAKKAAQINALDRYFSVTNQAKAKNYELIRDEVIASIGDYVLSATVLSEETDSQPVTNEDGKKVAETGLYTVVVRADINVNRLNNKLKSQSAIANTSTADKSLLTFVFVAREQKSVQSFDDKVYKRTDRKSNSAANSSDQQSSAESESFQGGSVSLQESTNRSTNSDGNSSDIVTTGGSTTTKADVVKWDVTRASEINSVMTGVFSNAGYEVVEAEYLEEESQGLVDLEAIRNDYRTGDDLASATLRNTAKGVKSVDIPYLALGTLDVGMKSTDPATGLVRVYVTVTGKVLNVSSRFPKTVSSVGPVQYAGLGPTASVARINAMKKAAETSALQLTDELNAKAVQ